MQSIHWKYAVQSIHRKYAVQSIHRKYAVQSSFEVRWLSSPFAIFSEVENVTFRFNSSQFGADFEPTSSSPIMLHLMLRQNSVLISRTLLNVPIIRA